MTLNKIFKNTLILISACLLLSACATQKEASEFGISATESLIAAMKINGTMDSLENLKAGLNKWKEIA